MKSVTVIVTTALSIGILRQYLGILDYVVCEFRVLVMRYNFVCIVNYSRVIYRVCYYPA